MMLRIDDVLHRQRRDGSNLFHQAIEVFVARVLGIDDDHALRGDANQCVGATPRHHVEVRLERPNLLNSLSGTAAPATSALARRRLGDEQRRHEQEKHGRQKMPEGV
ncbi:hypothetical protein D3C83_74020 [compost metagenome]